MKKILGYGLLCAGSIGIVLKSGYSSCVYHELSGILLLVYEVHVKKQICQSVILGIWTRRVSKAIPITCHGGP
jgi:hypothetical protein